MKKMIKIISFLLFAVTLLLLGCSCVKNTPVENPEQKENLNGSPVDPTPVDPTPVDPTPAEPDRSFEAIRLPAEVKTLTENGFTPETYALTSNSDSDNSAMSCISTMISPDFSVSVNGTQIPVYCTLAFIGTPKHGSIQSFATVLVNTPSNFEMDISVTALRGLNFETPVLLKESKKSEATKNGTAFEFTATALGSYTVLRADYLQDNCLTIFIKSNVDDNARIAEYKQKYGEDKVKVYEAGTHYVQNIMLGRSSVLYLCKGALLIAKPTTGTVEGGLIEINSVSDVHIAGYGYLELSLLEHSARIALRAYVVNNIHLKELTFINSGSWNVYFYNCSNSTIADVTVFGYRMNSDGINVCNSRYVTVSDSWIRTGDDCFSGKSLGGAATAIVNKVTFKNCTAWAGKARTFGIAGEVQKSVLSLSFVDCDVVFQDAIWDVPRLGALAIVVESSPERNTLQGILFENIHIYETTGRPINIAIYNSSITEMTISAAFKNITCDKIGSYHSTLTAANNTNSITATIQNFKIAGVDVTTENIQTDANSTVTFSSP